MNGPRLPSGPAHFLLLEDNDLVAIAYQRAHARYGIVTVSTTVAEAEFVVAMTRLTGLVADVALPDGSGIELAREARGRQFDLPILLLSGAVDALRLEAADEIRASYLLKPVEAWQLTRFATRAIARQRRAELLLESWVDRYELSAAEAMTLRLAVDGLRREEIAGRRGVGPGTVKNQIHGLLAKLAHSTLAEAVAAFYRELATDHL